ncbi:hypothetical protein GGTG_09246 [Gaeumannomyces tritici R3-111a-1]|uniref:Uncharacterized protein n=1 Tax=Gaeumannomyces tritici (strain R3-111a-1) TaxID=644352 RepID=J3P6V4_GAET3|nr:hypothetical protein GGTG_09246 [Gaeumannomyces tritici R3-111a-1]EJT72380.1 hypothetical protein GGTG_09246 [Gaeumannomyces tritici R3-111a-1]
MSDDWQHVPRTWADKTRQPTQSSAAAAATSAGAGAGVPGDASAPAGNMLARWLAEPAGSSPFNTVGQVRRVHGASGSPDRAPAPAPSTNHATTGSAKE